MDPTHSSAFTLLRRHGPTAFVLAALAAVGIWGHTTGWRAPKFSALGGSKSPGPKEDWCELHSVPASRCLSCNPALAGVSAEDAKDWCREHGVPESKCTVCHPEILRGAAPQDWCAEHGVPESQCTICNPDLAVKRDLAAPEASGVEVMLDPEAKAESRRVHCQTHALWVQFASSEALRKAGVVLAKVETRPMSAWISAPGEVEYDQTRVARVSSPVSGVARRVQVELGAKVTEGEVLALVDSAEVGKARAELLQGLAQVEVRTQALKRLQASLEVGFRNRGEIEEAGAALRAARIGLLGAQQALANLGLAVCAEELAGLAKLSEDDLAARAPLLGLSDRARAALEGQPRSTNLVPIAAPLGGTVVDRDVVPGELVDPSQALFVIADTTRMWAVVEVRLDDASRLEVGQKVVFRPDSTTSPAVPGSLTWVASEVDEKTRTVKARADLDNAEGILRAHSFGTARVVVRESDEAAAVPSEAVQWEGCCHVVFVQTRDDLFKTRKVRLGARSGGYTEVLVGLVPGEVVAARGSHVLKSEILRSRLGAGCCAE